MILFRFKIYIKFTKTQRFEKLKSSIDWESSEILATENDYKKRRFLESFYIQKTDFSFNDKINSFYPGLYKFINF